MTEHAVKKAPLHVLQMQPVLIEKIWGGRKLADLFGKELPAQGRYGESWEVADLPEGQSSVAAGPLAGCTLSEVVGMWGRELVGTAAPDAARFPLLVKLLDANADLSVQVHPGQQHLAELPGAHSKDECWMILDAEPGASIVHGLNGEVLPEAFAGAAREGTLKAVLHHEEVRAGEVVRVSPGTIHAIGAGVALLEVQEPSDTTYRVYDYNRPGLDGELRALHLDEAMMVSRLCPSAEVALAPIALGQGVELRVDAPGYRLETVHVAGQADVSWEIARSSAQVIYCVAGALSLNDGLGGKLELKAGQTVVVPAALGRVQGQVRDARLAVAGLGGDLLLRDLRVVSVGAEVAPV
ncbi:mannose-6-phosphate isomerase [Lujinxingia litoralis]|uniref:Mannose-6-phosphate isomerase n=1 Tax=Lujinxingia litoralis TaxID=2211119 RepID=A0A328C807_9DELT|nr:type I phosphomannose isomerase catalytic subunit [Lujinxingia litoralis]RAL24717.1 mannose-6-phosphate isomerase [Lujinxingia litoralis]